MNLSTAAINHRSRLVIYQFLALATSKPHGASWSRILDPQYLELVQAAVEVIRHDPKAQPDTLAPGELPLTALDLTPLTLFLAESSSSAEGSIPAEGSSPKIAEGSIPAKGSVQAFCDQYDSVFGLLLSKECPPYETQYCPQTFSVFRSHQLGDIAGYYRAFGLEPSSESPQRHDHISLELEFMAWLNTKTLYAMEQGDCDNESLCRDAQLSFFKQHLSWWVTAFALALRKKADGIEDERQLTSPAKSFLGAVGVFLAAFIAAERGLLGIAPPTILVAPGEGNDSQGCDTTECELSADCKSCAATVVDTGADATAGPTMGTD